MCLVTRKFFPRIALRNIPIYKEVISSLYRVKDTGNYYSSIRQAFIGNQNSFPITQVPTSKFKFPRKSGLYRVVEDGFIHCYNTTVKWKSSYGKLLVGYIPKGTLYYKNTSEYAARKVIYTGEA